MTQPRLIIFARHNIVSAIVELLDENVHTNIVALSQERRPRDCTPDR